MRRVIAAGIIIFRKTDEGTKFLLLYHGRNYWNFPKGKLEKEEKSWQAALREVREETGLKSTELRFVADFKTKEQFMYNQGKEKIFKIVILYMAETTQNRITVSHEHEGYGWFTASEARRMLSKHKDSVKILDNAYGFLQRQRTPHRRPNPPRQNPHVPRSGAPSGETASVPSSGQHTE